MDYQLNQFNCFLSFIFHEVFVAIYDKKLIYERCLNIFVIPKVPNKHIDHTLTIRGKLIIGPIMDSSDERAARLALLDLKCVELGTLSLELKFLSYLRCIFHQLHVLLNF
jgi:hypothetical protein